MPIDSKLQTEALEDLSSAPNYQDWLASLPIDHLGDNPLELGSGIGDYAAYWLAQGVAKIRVTEADHERLACLENRFSASPSVQVSTFETAIDSGEKFSSLVSFNVLEHVEDPTALLAKAVPSLDPGAPVMAFVPAFNFAMSRFDREIGHYRRYTVRSLSDELRGAGLTIEEVRYVNMPGLVAWTVGMRLLRMRPGQGPFLKYWDRWVIPATRKIESNRSVPFGQSVWAVARTPSL